MLWWYPLTVTLALIAAGIPSGTWWLEIYRSASHYVALYFLLAFVRLPKGLPSTVRTSLRGGIVLYWGWILFCLPLWHRSELAFVPGNPVTLLYANLLSGNAEPERFRSVLAREKPEILSVIELDKAWLHFMPSETEYPHRIVLENGTFGVGLFSKYPLAPEAETSVGDDLVPYIHARVLVPGRRPLSLYLLHAHPPLSTDVMHENVLYFRRISTKVRHDTEPRIVMGDFNATPTSGVYQRFVSGTLLVPIASGLERTWSAFSPFLRFQIDHVLVSEDIETLDQMRMEAIGSDHFPLRVRIRWS